MMWILITCGTRFLLSPFCQKAVVMKHEASGAKAKGQIPVQLLSTRALQGKKQFLRVYPCHPTDLASMAQMYASERKGASGSVTGLVQLASPGEKQSKFLSNWWKARSQCHLCS